MDQIIDQITSKIDEIIESVNQLKKENETLKKFQKEILEKLNEIEASAS